MVFVSLSIVYFKTNLCALHFTDCFTTKMQNCQKKKEENSRLFSLNLIYSVSVEIIHNAADVQTANSVLSPLFFFFFFLIRQ